MIDGGSDHREPDRDVYARLNSHNLHRSMTLIVVHGDDEIEVSALRTIEEGVRWQGAFDVEALFLASVNGRLNFLFFFAMTKESVFACVRIDATHSDPRVRDARCNESRVPADDRAFN